jgi:hypothetical protein
VGRVRCQEGAEGSGCDQLPGDMLLVKDRHVNRCSFPVRWLHGCRHVLTPGVSAQG